MPVMLIAGKLKSVTREEALEHFATAKKFLGEKDFLDVLEKCHVPDLEKLDGRRFSPVYKACIIRYNEKRVSINQESEEEAEEHESFFKRHEPKKPVDCESRLEKLRERVNKDQPFFNGYFDDKCESPIEELFALEFISFFLDRISDLIGAAQFQNPTTGKYRLDFGFVKKKIAVELDGHEWHEKTKEQVIERNKRDRDLQMSGWKVFHLSGTELLRDPESFLHDLDILLNP